MSPASTLHNANGPTLKRSFTAATISSPTSPEQPAVLSATKVQAGPPRRANGNLVQTQASKRRQPLYHRFPKMSSTAGPRSYENHIPSFMSVYDLDSSVMESRGSLSPDAQVFGTELANSQDNGPQILQSQPPQELEKNDPQVHSHQHRESTSTQASDSTDSSPTTTISTVDSSSLSDPSPSSSPESPITIVPLSSFTSTSFGLESFHSLNMADSNRTIRIPLSDERPMTSPSPRKAKNPKSLALNLQSDAFSQSSEPSSPSFIKPPTLQARRKPSQLSLNTGAANTNPFVSEPLGPLGSAALPLMQRRGLKHSISSPQMLLTPAFGPSGGMNFGDFGRGTSRLKDSRLATSTIDEDGDHECPLSVQMATRVPGVTVGGDSFDRPHSGEDAKSPSYPEGPILMHEPNVHLYLEPNIEEAMKFDVVINVAREVKNPFTATKDTQNLNKTDPSPTSSLINPNPDMTPDTAATMFSFKTAFEVQPAGSESSPTESSPATPKPSVDTRSPEYIHVPWDHNTDVKDELWDLCELIESRTRQGKRVLVHCQQGASRSATLIIAYGMYLNPDLSPNEAYKQAQSRSRWVNPNMSLLFSLNDFKKIIDQKKVDGKVVKKSQSKHRPTLSEDGRDSPSTPSRARGNSTPSAPSTTIRDTSLVNPDESMQGNFDNDNAIRHRGSFDFGFSVTSAIERQVVETKSHNDSDWESGLMSPRISKMTNNPLQRTFNFSRPLPLNLQEPPTPGLFSPRISEFPRTFFRQPQRPLLPAEDPRSPPTKGEAPIIRSIDDIL